MTNLDDDDEIFSLGDDVELVRAEPNVATVNAKSPGSEVVGNYLLGQGSTSLCRTTLRIRSGAYGLPSTFPHSRF